MKLTLKLVNNCLAITLFSSLFFFIGCVSEKIEPVNGIDGLDGFNALVDIKNEPAGDNCDAGGLKISVGQDDNQNNILDEIEIESINYICNGSAGADGVTPSNLLAVTSPEQPGDNCEFGGTLIEIGNDSNNNGLLDEGEIVSSFFICNGKDGADGQNGSDGSDGADGFSSIIKATSEAAGDNCSNGGLKIEIGIDSNDNQALDTDEIQSTYFICNGANGTDGADGQDGSNGSDGANGLSTLSNVITEPAGANCTNGGYKIEIGLDSNSNGTLDAGEVSSENFICNGDDGMDGNNGFSSLMRISTELPGDNCSDGGMKLEVGLDDITVNGVLDDDEVDYTQYVCDGLNGGENGLSTIIQTTTEEPGTNCGSGGVRIQVGLDANTNNELDAGEEIGSPIYVCNGLDGINGTDGVDGKDVIVISSAAASCSNGGSTLTFGHDGNSDGDLADDEDEILSEITICNGLDGADGTDGSDGYNTIIETTSIEPGANCTNGGLSFTVGLDINRNNSIDTGEEIDTYFVCNGENGADGSNGSDGSDGRDVIVTSGAATTCANGGIFFEFGYDGNGDGDLNDTEDTILSSNTICNGVDGENGNDGLNTIINASAIEAGDDCANGGMSFQVGLDLNRNNVIDAGEEIDTYFVCNGTDGSDGADGSNGRDVIVTSSAAASCANGGITLEFGYDGNSDGDLNDDEDTVLSSTTICNGTNGNDGTDGYNTIIETVTESPGDNCANGGTKFTVGLDTNRNNEIDAGEEVGTYYVCDGNDGSNGSNGRNSLIDITSFSNSQGGCADGGLKIDTGLDTNSDGILQAGEILSTAYVCNGSDGSDGSDGNSDGVFEFYFQEGFDGYSGAIDISISDKNGNENGEVLSVDNGSIDSHTLLYFPGVEKMENTIGTNEFEIVEAILYLKGQSTRIDGVNSDNWIGVKAIQPGTNLFKEEGVSWTSIDGSQNWSVSGATSNESDGDAFSYSDMYRLPSSIVFNGYIPLLLNKSEIGAWRSLDSNKGLVLLMADDGVPYQLDIIASESTKNTTERPTLYIKAKVSTRGRSEHVSHSQQKRKWDQMSYQEKLAPLRRK